MANVTLSWKYDSNVVDKFTIHRSDSPFEISSIEESASTKIGEVGPTSIEFKDFVIEPFHKYFYRVLTIFGTSFKVSEIVEVGTGDEGGGTELSWSPLDLDCLVLLSGENVQEGNVVRWESQAGPEIFDKQSKGTITKKGDDLIFENSSVLSQTAGTLINNNDRTTAFIVAKNTNDVFNGGGQNASCYLFVPYVTANRNSFSMYQQLTNTNPAVYIRNRTTKTNEWLNNEVFPTTPSTSWFMATMFSNWIDGKSGLSLTFGESTQTQSQSHSLLEVRAPLGSSMGIGASNNTNRGSIDAHFKCVVILREKHTKRLQELLEGWAAWKFNLVSELPENHRFKNLPPQKGMI